MRRLPLAAFVGLVGLGLAACSTTSSTPGTTLAPTVSTPTSGSTVADCSTGTVSISAAQALAGTGSCLHVGGVLAVDFDKSHGIGAAGPWIGTPRSDDTAVLALLETSTDGNLLHALFRATAPGTTSIGAYWDVTCSGPQTTPCTIPPQGYIRLPVTVVP